MNILQKIWRWLRSLGQRRAVKQEIDEELRFHVEQRTAENVAAGMSPEEAAREARRRFGNVQSVREQCRERRGASFGEATWQDIRYGARVLCKAPSFTMAVILTLAVGIGFNSSVFSLIYSMFLRTMPIRDASSVALLFNQDASGTSPLFSYFDYSFYRENARTFSGLVAVKREDPYLDETGRRVLVDVVSDNYLSVLGVGPDLPDQPLVVVSQRLWKSHFNADPNIKGKPISLNGHIYEIIGVAPRDFGGITFPPPDIWAPLLQAAKSFNYRLDDPSSRLFDVAGRLTPESSIKPAHGELDVLVQRLKVEHLNTNKNVKVITSPASYLNPRTRNNVVPMVVLLLGGAGLVLLIICANLANLLLARAVNRQREIALRSSLGATRARIICQLLTETLLLAFSGGLGGLLLTIWLPTIAVRAVTPPDLALYDYSFRIPLNYQATLYSFLLALATGLLFGLAPAVRFSKVNLSSALKEGTASTSDFRRSRLRNILIASQVAFSLVLLIISGLFVRSVLRATQVSAGFDTTNLVTVSLEQRSGAHTSAQVDDFYHQIEDHAKTLPQVRAIAHVDTLPLGGNVKTLMLESQNLRRQSAINIVSTNYFDFLAVSTVVGRSFSADDVRGGPAVAVINESAARLYWPGITPIGGLLRAQNGVTLQIIGVVKDFRDVHILAETQPHIYIPNTQGSLFRESLGQGQRLLLRVDRDIPGALQLIRAEAARIDPKFHLELSTTERIINLSVWPSRVAAAISSAVGLVALALASIGIYGSISYQVSQRKKEMAIRLALGSPKRQLIRVVLNQSMRTVVLGALAGIAGALAASRALGQFLYGLSTFDPPAFLIAPLALISVALLATYLPARRAAKVDPMVALRYE
jgi:predicted permease